MPRQRQNPARNVPVEPADVANEFLAKRPSRAKRDRTWERNNPTTAYRIPATLRDALKTIAQAEGITADDLARFALERFVDQYNAGEVTLQKHVKARYTLYPSEDE